MKFRTLLCDPPWQYEKYSYANHGAAETHYDGMTDAELCALPIDAITEESAVILLWCTWPKLKEGVSCLEAWGFRYVTGFPWLKMSAIGVPKYGIGWHSRGCSEFVLIGVKGSGMTPPIEKRQVGVIFSPVGKHSAKPDAQYDFAEAYGGPFLEIFARPDGGLYPDRDGWVRIGNEMTGRSVELDLRDLANDVPLPRLERAK